MKREDKCNKGGLSDVLIYSLLSSTVESYTKTIEKLSLDDDLTKKTVDEFKKYLKDNNKEAYEVYLNPSDDGGIMKDAGLFITAMLEFITRSGYLEKLSKDALEELFDNE